VIRRKHIRDVALREYAKHGDGQVPVDVAKIARELGATIHEEPVEDNVSGFLAWKNGRPVIGVNGSHSQNRKRFTIAHEIGHILLHPQLNLHIDDTFALKLRSDKSRRGEGNDEKEANIFAAELLMPITRLMEDTKRIGVIDVHDEQRIEQLAKSYKVSTQAMAIRLQQLMPFLD
jgi:Zn-dependent peptidase ImmA (M78 family)